MGKTIHEWLQELPIEYREKAIKNAKNSIPSTLNDIEINLVSALHGAFIFNETPEGVKYWSEIYKKLINQFLTNLNEVIRNNKTHMRIILFKAKAEHNSEWIKGYYHAWNERYDKRHHFLYIENGGTCSVIPETVCEYIGMNDANGDKIFESDTFMYNGEIRYVQYIEDRCRYVLTNGKGFDSRNTIDLDCDVIYGLKIIGNIHNT